MQGASINDIKSRIKSVEGTMQITKAMELVATSKLRGAKLRAESVKPYLAVLSDAIGSFTKESVGGGKELLIVVAGDRGLAGGYNNNVFKSIDLKERDRTLYLPIGKKAVEFLKRRELPVFSSSVSIAAEVGVGAAMKAAEEIYSAITSGEIGSVKVLYTRFVNMLTQTVVKDDIYPVKSDEEVRSDPLLDEEPEVILETILPQYIGGFIYGAVCESVASECAARRTAMNSANKNAEEMIEELTLSFNRARQAVITQEITEIVSGAEAL